MADEFDERFLHEQAHGRRRREHVDRAVHREHRSELPDLDKLSDHAFPSKARQTVVPDSSQ